MPTTAPPATPVADLPILTIDDLAVSFDSPRGPRVQAVDGVSMALYPRQTLAVVGESGCGKSVSAMSILRLIPMPPGRFDRGAIILDEGGGRRTELTRAGDADLQRVRGGKIAMIFQEPMTSLNPVYTVGDQILEAVLLHQKVSLQEGIEIAVRSMTDVGITDARGRLASYPHQFSGGMRQRVMIAMALACRPAILLADEPTTALDVTIQAQILELLRELQRTRGMGIMLITHALGVVAENADVVCVMYAGRVVEYGTVYDIFDRPLHPYTRGLLRAIPAVHDRQARLTTIREVTEDAQEFGKLSREFPGLTPWWPWHEPPKELHSTSKDNGSASDSVLYEALPGHWVGVWRIGAAASTPRATPMLPFRRVT